MAKITNSFAEWRRITRGAPDRLVSLFLNRLETLPAETRRALLAAIPDTDTLLQNSQAASELKDAPLSGIPYMLQDLFDIQELPTRCGAPFQEPFETPLEDSSLLYHKLTSLGAILLAKTVPSEFGIDPRGRNLSFGSCPHADGLRYICGGGAGACAHAVSAGWVPIAFGLDSSAGMRIPAAFHGLFGFRMGNNVYAREGVFPIVPSLDSVAWITAQIEDLQSSIAAICPTPPTQQIESPRGYLLNDPSIQLDPNLKINMMELTRYLDVHDTPRPNKALCKAFKESSEAFATIESRELYSIHQYWIEEYRTRYPEHLLRRIEAGQICNAEKADKAALTQQRVRETMVNFFQEYDYLIIPISASPTPDRADWSGQISNDLIRLNAPTSLSFLPALILPFPCDEGRHSAVQLLINPRKVQLCSKIIDQVKGFYA
ncbi:amidase family protein [Coraliomargarita sp. SDUM461004]|uniref:Amidase family protein n=1 Tax=Thalassobacterium sedimentorum TaxID=3041258 RepID=A0ABU1AMW3_9BACT|nr:amidase family protein [Coraliomargarita sp. SDUM461004]MDQ8194948.1 amidase family protein [Coraliomargarita sp. SDUM461004]